VIWVEILGRHREVVARQRCDGPEVRIGRAYDNDVVLDDPFVAPRHLRVFRDEDGRLVAEDAGSAGGVFVDGGGREARAVVDGDRALRLGRTLVRIRDAGHPVAPERIDRPVPRAWPRAAVLAAAVSGLELLSAWLSETAEFKATHYVLPLAALAALVLAWTTGWAILCRIFSGQARFERHLAIALVALLVLSVFQDVVDFSAFAFSWRFVADWSYVAVWGLIAATCLFHLREIAPTRLKLKATIVFGLGAAVAAAQGLAKSELKPLVGRQSYLRDLKPPFVRVVPPQDDARFFTDADALKSKLDRARKDEPPAAAWPAFESDD
jgi:hypothetical protein